MTTLLLSHRVASANASGIQRLCRELGRDVNIIALPEDPDGRLAEDVCATVDTAFFSHDVHPTHSRQFFSTVRKAPKLKWLQVFNAGVDHPIFTEMIQRGARVTTSAGAGAVPIAHTAICGLLMLSRNMPRWLAAQREHKWDPMLGSGAPRDLRGQTVVVFGMGHIGAEIAQLAKALGMTVVGIRRSPRTADDPVDEMHTPERLAELLPRADWLVIAAPLTAETRKLVNAEVLSKLRPEAGLINIARGEIVDEQTLIDALRNGRLAGAYLDVFEQEPLPPESPLWDMPNVIVTPHNSSASLGNDERVYEVFIENLRRWLAGEALMNEVKLR
jgi:phosphoglycerate dehydrogenase-like enzyme